MMCTVKVDPNPESKVENYWKRKENEHEISAPKGKGECVVRGRKRIVKNRQVLEPVGSLIPR